MLSLSKIDSPVKPEAGHIYGELIPGKVDIRHFRLLMTMCSVTDPEIHKSLEDVLVYGMRPELYVNDSVTCDGFLDKYRQVQEVSKLIYRGICLMDTE